MNSRGPEFVAILNIANGTVWPCSWAASIEVDAVSQNRNGAIAFIGIDIGMPLT